MSARISIPVLPLVLFAELRNDAGWLDRVEVEF
jgi:hypothetical protein